jgi:hypothetical protein
MEESTVLSGVLHINKYSHQLIPVNLAGVLPLALYPLSFRGYCSKLVTEFD